MANTTITSLPYSVAPTDDMALAIEDDDLTWSLGLGDLRKFLNKKYVEKLDADFDTLNEDGFYKVLGTSSNAPASNTSVYIVQVAQNTGVVTQTAKALDLAGNFPLTYSRRYTGTEWTTWTSSSDVTFTKWAINSGHTVEGQNAIMEGLGTNSLSFNTQEPIVMTTAAGNTIEIKSIPSTPINNGEHNIFYDVEAESVRVYANKVYIQDAAPADPLRFDIWLDTSKEPLVCKQYNGSWIPRDLVLMGSVKVEADNITEIKNRGFNVNGAEQRKSRLALEVDDDNFLDISSDLLDISGKDEFFTVPFDGRLEVCIASRAYCRFSKKGRVTGYHPSGFLNIGSTDEVIFGTRDLKKGDKLYVQCSTQNPTYYVLKRYVEK